MNTSHIHLAATLKWVEVKVKFALEEAMKARGGADI
jgi:hypothetical protein